MADQPRDERGRFYADPKTAQEAADRRTKAEFLGAILKKISSIPMAELSWREILGDITCLDR
jgi:hypothetical protein